MFCDNYSTEVNEILQKYDIAVANEYGEPGYASEYPVALANWNSIPKEDAEVLEEVFNLEWDDEWVIFTDGSAYRIMPDSYSWQPTLVFPPDGDPVTPDSDDASTVLEIFCIEDPHQPLSTLPHWFEIDSEAKEEGWYKLPEVHEAGMYAHQQERPEDVVEFLFEHESISALAIQITSSRQFDLDYVIYVKK